MRARLQPRLVRLVLASSGALALACGAPGCAGSGARDARASDSLARGSDERAVAIAEEVLRALGGADAWDETRVVAWTFFGRRNHVWDKSSGDYRLEEGSKVVLMNLESGVGRVFDGGVELADPAAVAQELARAKSVWINDSYWLVMPYKLFDPGVRLFDAGEEEREGGAKADVLRVEFEDVGDTPDNAYEVLVDRQTKLVTGWRYFQRRDDPAPRIETPWAGWQRFGGILLSGDRGPQREISGIRVFTTPPEELKRP
ncbi:MAG: hypothetical protein JNK02_14505 [Planctomycetes bacterium]|nr:hypothetical protein [Planctomycetota bacterium]